MMIKVCLALSFLMQSSNNFYNCGQESSAVSHSPQFGDANTSSAGDAASPTGDVDVSARDAHF